MHVKSAAMNQPASNVAEYTVSELSFALKRTVEENFEHVRVRGEISGFKGAVGSGHCYFRLKDDKACLEAVIWKTTLLRLRFKPQDGLEMVATGKLTTYPGRSNYQIVIDSLEPAGEGALMALLEERRKKLQAEGLFDQARKQPIPYLPQVIGVVTSPTGAVIRDILHRLRDRFPSRVLLWPVRVQGDGAAEEVAAAVHGFNAVGAGGTVPRPDLLIVARGGGSIEDLWAFNEEVACSRRRREPHSGDRRGRPRDGLDAARPRRRPARAHPDRGSGDGGAGPHRAPGRNPRTVEPPRTCAAALYGNGAA
jgi:exodeoxyribonuclease VII large subunit